MIVVGRLTGTGATPISRALSRELQRGLDQGLDQWCWLELCPAQTTMGEAWLRLKSEPINSAFFDAVQRSRDGTLTFYRAKAFIPAIGYVYRDPAATDRIGTIQIPTARQGFTLGQAILQFGPPRQWNWAFPTTYTLEICFDQAVCVFTLALAGESLRPSLMVDQVQLVRAGSLSNRRARYLPWQGFRRMPAE
jgi:hypothetical protein